MQFIIRMLGHLELRSKFKDFSNLCDFFILHHHYLSTFLLLKVNIFIKEQLQEYHQKVTQKEQNIIFMFYKYFILYDQMLAIW